MADEDRTVTCRLELAVLTYIDRLAVSKKIDGAS